MARSYTTVLLVAAITLAAVGIVGCGDRSAETSRPAGEEVEGPSFDPQTAAALRALIEEELSFTAEVGGSYTIRGPQGAFWHQVVGVSELQTSSPMQADARFVVGSNTKLVVAVVVMQLVEQGKMSIDDTLGKLLPDQTQWRGVTVRHLLSMQSGIPDYLRATRLQADIALNHHQAFSPDRLLGYVSRSPLDFAPGEKCIYSDTNYLLLGQIIEKITGQAADQAIAERVIVPLGLKNTYLRTQDVADEKLAHGYIEFDVASANLGVPFAFYGIIPSDRRIRDHIVDSTDYFHPSFTWTAGGLISTTNDMAEIMEALFTGKLVRPETLAQMMQTRRCSILSREADYGLGIQREDTALGDGWGHGGLTYGYSTHSIYIPQRKIALSHMQNYYPDEGAAIEDELLSIAQDGAAGRSTESCRAPAGFPDLDADNQLNFSFRGPLSISGTSAPQGIAWIRAVIGGRYQLYHGAGTSASRGVDASTPLEITSDVPPTGTFSSPRRAVLRFAPSRVMPTEGAAPQVLLYDVTQDKPAAGQRMFCVTAVGDPARQSRLSFCSRPPEVVKPGELFRVYGSVGLSSAAGEIDRQLGQAALGRCFCLNEQGQTISCTN
jgi:D-alanyl-D-alanine carboxypeptidase